MTNWRLCYFGLYLFHLVANDAQTAAKTNISTHNNLTPAEKGAIQELKEMDDIVIKPADNGRLFRGSKQKTDGWKILQKNWTLTPLKNSALK
jgi:hypothetical protein